MGDTPSSMIKHRLENSLIMKSLSAYLFLGLLHESIHVIAAWVISPKSRVFFYSSVGNGRNSFVSFVIRALLGRYSLVELDIERDAFIVRHSAWVFSTVVAFALHFLNTKTRSLRAAGNKANSSATLFVSDPLFVIAAYITALEAVTTDLLGFVPVVAHLFDQDIIAENGCQKLMFFCGNFGIILLSPSWINVDGGKKSLEMLEKMVNVTMMRGAQSGGVVTYEPTNYGVSGLFNYSSSNNSNSFHPPVLRGLRSRVVNAKRTDLSKGIRSKIVKDNCTAGKLRGWNKPEFNVITSTNPSEQCRLVRVFLGHTRFATSSKASMDGTHPHQWSPKHIYRLFPFQSAQSSKTSKSSSKLVEPAQPMPVEKFVTHNGDFEFYKIQGRYYDTEAIQKWLVKTLHVPIPAIVDSAAIAGIIDLLRCQGSFALSVRFALCFSLRASSGPMDSQTFYPTLAFYEEIGLQFEQALMSYIKENGVSTLEVISSSPDKRQSLVSETHDLLRSQIFSTAKTASATSWIASLSNFVSFDVEAADLQKFAEATINAFFDNDLLHSVRIFLENAKGSFGLCVSTTIDAHRQVCFAAKGQTCSVAFYPRTGVICYGSEQAAVKAGLNYDLPTGQSPFGTAYTPVNEDSVRIDLDDLGGEICLIDWGWAGDSDPSISPPNRGLTVNKMMGGAVNVVLYHQNESLNNGFKLSKRLIPLENNVFIKPLLNDTADPVLSDIQDIPRVCYKIQKDWKDVGLNRMTAWNLSNCVRERLMGYVEGRIECHASQVDILVTGCEVSLWVAEQFIADLRKCFPKMYVRAVSSNKVLGLFGQELAMPAIGFEYTQKTLDMKDPIVIIVSHSGGTFGPLACSNLLQSFSSSIFCVCSEWDTQVGKQLRTMYTGKTDLLSSRIFSTEVGVRPAEPCSVSVVATHQLLTNIFEHISLAIISDPHFRHVTGAIINERDLQTLERCNQLNVLALEDIVGRDRYGKRIQQERREVEKELRAAGDLWSEHILENAKAYVMTFVYIIVTVTSGYPIVSGIATAVGLTADWAFYITRCVDAFIYFWLPQINITIIRLLQGRDLRHRMVGRTVAIGDPCPWVAQSAEAFLSKIFACSYSIAGCAVISGNPADHFVHRHTHRVTRGTLLVCGRPDGRLSALTSLEASTCLAVNQASSIQSIGGTCESITIGHNNSKLPLSKMAIYLKSHRPKFLCEQVLSDLDEQETKLKQQQSPAQTRSRRSTEGSGETSGFNRSSIQHSKAKRRSTIGSDGEGRSSASLLGAYANLEKEAKQKFHEGVHDTGNIHVVLKDMIKERQSLDKMRAVFSELDEDGSGELDYNEFVNAFKKLNPDAPMDHLQTMFQEADVDDSGTLDFEEFKKIIGATQIEILGKLSVTNRDDLGLIQVQPSKETYFGEELLKTSPRGFGQFMMSQNQHLAHELYESRVASMQRFVAMTVMFHQMGMRVQSFFPKISMGLLGYRMDRTHSIMRIATTASPVSGADVRDRMVELRLRGQIFKAVNMVERHWKSYQSKKVNNKKDIKSTIMKHLVRRSTMDSHYCISETNHVDRKGTAGPKYDTTALDGSMIRRKSI